MKRRTIITTIFFCVALFVSFSVFGQEFEIRGATLVKYNGNAANVTIPEGITYIGGEAFSTNSSITNIIIPYSVISIERSAFDGCSNLTGIFVDAKNRNYSSMQGVLFNKDRTFLIRYPAGKQGNYTIPEGITAIGDYGFSFCSSLTEITLPSSLTSIGHRVFEGCTGFISITMNTQNSAYTSVEGVLFNKNGTVLVAYPTCKQGNYTIPSNVTAIGDYAFYGCTGLTGVTIPEGLTSVGYYAFYKCNNLTSMLIPASVTTIRDTAFYECPLPMEARYDIIERFGEGPFLESPRARGGRRILGVTAF